MGDLLAVDGRTHAVQLEFDIGRRSWPSTRPEQPVEWQRVSVEGLAVTRVGSREQRVLGCKKGDDLRIDWGYAYLACCWPGACPAVGRRGGPGFDLGQVYERPVARHVLVAYDDLYSLKYFGRKCRPDREPATAPRPPTCSPGRPARLPGPGRPLRGVRRPIDRRSAAVRRRAVCPALRACLSPDLGREQDRGRCQRHAAGVPEGNFTNGCIGTVDVLFPQAPFFLVLQPALTKAMLVPILDYASSPAGPTATRRTTWAPTHATGQVYGMGGGDGDRMPVEEAATC